MADHSAIEWTDATWNPITGCSVTSPGCKHCYAMGLAGTRLQHHPSRKGLTIAGKAGPVWNGDVRLNREWLTQPLQWKRPRMIFVCAHGDLFHESVPDAWIDLVFAVMALCPQHTFQVLTKRSARMRAYMATPDRKRAIAERVMCISTRRMREVGSHEGGIKLDHFSSSFAGAGPFPNIWLGVSVEDQRRANERIPDLMATPAAVYYVSAEPLLEWVDFERIALADGTWIDALRGHVNATTEQRASARRPWLTPYQRGLDWIIVGGESGPKARAMHPAWAREIRDQCAAAGVAFHFKQWGAWQPREWCRDGGTHAMRVGGGQESFQRIQSHPDSIERVGAGPEWSAFALVGKKAAGRLLDNVEHNGMPAHAAASDRPALGAAS